MSNPFRGVMTIYQVRLQDFVFGPYMNALQRHYKDMIVIPF